MDEPMCVCRKPRIDLTDRCTICGLERVHVMPKVPMRIVDEDREEAA